MKIKDRVCDVCGNSIYRHAHHAYTIRKRMWETETIGRRLDLCEDCWRKFEQWAKMEVEHDWNTRAKMESEVTP